MTIATPWKKSPLFPSNPPLKIEVLSSPRFWKFGWRLNPPCRKGGCTLCQFLSIFLCGYRKGYGTQTALISMQEKWRKTLDIKEYAGAVLMDLSKASDTINHELLLAKLHEYGFSMHSLLILSNYLSNRKQSINK